MREAAGRVREALTELLGVDPIELLRTGRPRSGLLEQPRERLTATVDHWPVATRDQTAACVLLERLALQIDRAADWVAKGPEALPWLVEQRHELIMAAYNLNRVAFRCPRGLRAFGDNASRYIQRADELADRTHQLLDVLESQLAALDDEPVQPDRTLPADLTPYRGQHLGTITEHGVPLTLWAEAQWDADDTGLMHVRLTAVAPDGAPAALIGARRREPGQLVDGDLPASTASPADTEAEARNIARCSTGAGVLIIDDVIVEAAFSGQGLGPRIARRAGELLVGPEGLVILAAQPRANRCPPEARERLHRHWQTAGWRRLSSATAWVARPPSRPDSAE